MNEKKDIPEVELAPETEKALLRTYEDDILGGLLAAAGFREDEEEQHLVEIARERRGQDGREESVVFFAFHIRPLSDEEYRKCRERHTKYIRSKNSGTRVPEELDLPAYRSEVLYCATVEADRKKLWDNKDAWKALDVVTGVQVIDKVLKAGEKDAVIDLIDKISGFSPTLEETAKN